MNNKLITRRRLLSSAAGLSAALTVPTKLWAQKGEEGFPQGATDAQQRLLKGNERFAAGQSVHDHASKEWRKRLTTGQKPFATILGCSDSRVPLELVFDQGFGDLFVIRVAGNVVSSDVVGSLEYAWYHLHVPLLVVLGHEECGAVTAALDSKLNLAKEPERIETLVRMIEPGLKDIDLKQSPEKRLSAAVKANVRWSMTQLAELPEVKRGLADNKLKMIGAVYDLETGRASVLPRL
jgi:carbonic anhydrase